MEPEEEDIYDDGSSVAPSPLSNLKNKFEQHSFPTNINPALKPKPASKPFQKLGGGGYLQGVVGKDNIPNGSIENSSKDDKGSESGTGKGDDSSSIRDKESARHVINNVLAKRNSKIDSLVEKFKETDNSSPNTAPNTAPKPKPKTLVRKYFDSNNNSKADTKESDKTVEEKMTGGIEQKTSEKSSQGIPLGLSVHERAKRLTENLPNMKPENLGGLKNKPGIKPQTSEKPKSPAGTGVYKKFTIPKDKSQAGDFAVELRRKIVDSQDPKKSLHRVSVKSVIRNFDEKKFKIAPRDSVKANEKPPEKPAKLDEEIDWEDLETEYKRITQEKAGLFRIKSTESSSDHGIKELEEEEFYDDCGNMVPAERISFIEPMTEEEELGDESQWEKHGFTGLGDNEEFPPPPTEILVDGHVQEEYDDVAGPGADKRESGGSELYEPLPDELDEPPPPSPRPGGGEEEPPEPPPQPPPEPPRPPKDSKESEKEKKRKEKEEREKKAREEKEERERKAKEEREERERKAKEEKEEREKKKKLDKEQKELKKLADKFKIPMADLAKSVGQGKIKTTVKSSKSHLGVQEGDSVEIIRMNEPNPKGKFLVRLTESQAVGYVDSSNIEVDTGIIRRLMEGSESATSSGPNSGQDEDVIGETYEDVDGQGEGEGEGLIEEDIYEECT